MNASVLEEILNCSELPSLPAVAVRVIEQSSDPDVSMTELAATISSDQALSAKVLRTVNSSFYGLRQKCSSIQKALVMLGLGPVKSLALGFSLVNSIETDQNPAFDYVGYWRRSLYTAMAAQAIAEAARLEKPEEAFLCGLLQDIGMIAMYRGLGERYLEVCEKVGWDHRRLAVTELEALEVQHPDVGAMLGKRWKLPDSLALPVRFHERPTAAPQEHAGVVKAIAMGNLIHDALTDEDPTGAVRRVYEKGSSWFKLRPDECEACISRVADNARELSNLFSLDTGPYSNAEQIIRQAEERLVNMTERPIESFASRKFIEQRGGDAERDPLTGMLTKASLGIAMSSAHQIYTEENESYSVTHVAVERLAEVIEAFGEGGRDAALMAIATLLNKHFEPVGGLVFRLGTAVYGVLAPCDSEEAGRVGEAFRRSIDDVHALWTPSNAIERVHITCSLGVAGTDAVEDPTPERVVLASAHAVQEARAAGGNRVRRTARQAKAA